MKKIRYDLISAYNSGIDKHPQINMKELGYIILHVEPIPMGDCIIYEVEEIKYPLPKYITIISNG